MKYIVGNWKMNLGIRESVALARNVLHAMRGHEVAPQVVLCPSFTALSEVRKVLTRSRIGLGAQDCGTEKSGAFTGNVSVGQLEDVGCAYVLVGHSERRHIFHESDELVRKKFASARQSKLQPILCVGEPQEDRENGNARVYVQGQLGAALEGVSLHDDENVLIAYEPVWAIGSGDSATVGDVIEMHSFIRKEVAGLLEISENRITVLYGGSITDENAYTFLREDAVDGLLVGGASLKPQLFSGILQAGIDVAEAQQ